MLSSSVICFVTRTCKQSYRYSYHGRIKSRYLLNDLKNFNETITESVTSDNIESHKKARLRHISENTFLEPLGVKHLGLSIFLFFLGLYQI